MRSTSVARLCTAAASDCESSFIAACTTMAGNRIAGAQGAAMVWSTATGPRWMQQTENISLSANEPRADPDGRHAGDAHRCKRHAETLATQTAEHPPDQR